MNRFECQQGPQGPGVQSLSIYPGPGGSWDRGVSAILPASKEAESPSRITIPYQGGSSGILFIDSLIGFFDNEA